MSQLAKARLRGVIGFCKILLKELKPITEEMKLSIQEFIRNDTTVESDNGGNSIAKKKNDYTPLLLDIDKISEAINKQKTRAMVLLEDSEEDIIKTIME